jgi:hypothetical protein
VLNWHHCTPEYYTSDQNISAEQQLPSLITPQTSFFKNQNMQPPLHTQNSLQEWNLVQLRFPITQLENPIEITLWQ